MSLSLPFSLTLDNIGARKLSVRALVLEGHSPVASRLRSNPVCISDFLVEVLMIDLERFVCCNVGSNPRGFVHYDGLQGCPLTKLSCTTAQPGKNFMGASLSNTRGLEMMSLLKLISGREGT